MLKVYSQFKYYA